MNELDRRSLIVGTTGLLAAAVCVTRAAAQNYPQRPVKIIVPYAPGGGCRPKCGWNST